MPNSQLPPGFTLDSAPSAALPPGFTLDTEAPPEPAQPPPRTKTEAVMRQLGITFRNFEQGVLAPFGLLADVPAAIGNVPFQAYDYLRAPTTEELITGQKKPSFRFPEQNQLIAQTLTNVGVPQPETEAERVSSGLQQALIGAATGIGAGSVLAGSTSPVTSAVGETLASQPGLQGVSAVTGAAGSEAARSSGLGPVGQTVGGIVGAVAPSAAIGVGGALMRGVLRGGPAGSARINQNLETFRRAGTTPTVGQATESRLARAAENQLARTPGGAGPILAKAQGQAEDVSAALEQRAMQLAGKTSGEVTGRQIQRSIRGEGGFVDRFKAKQEQLYDKLDEFIPENTRIDVSKTQAALKDLNAQIPGAPNVSRFFQNSKIRGIENALEADINNPTDERQALETATDQLAALKRSRDLAVQESGKFQAQANEQQQLGRQYFPVPGFPRFPGRYSPHPERAAEASAAAEQAQQVAAERNAAIAEMQQKVAELDSLAATTDGKLPYEAIKKLRTLVGREIADSGLASDVPRSKWKALYAALSDDLGQAVEGNAEARAAWNRANNYTRVGLKRLEAIESVIDRNGGPERIFQAAMSGTREGASTLRAVMQSTDDAGRKMITATVLRRLGLAKPGQRGALGDQFSTETFLTNWNSLSPEAKATLFNRYGPGFRSDMDQVARLAANLREGSQVFRNPSGTAQATAQATAAATFLLSLLTGNFVVAGAVAGGAGTANLLSRAMGNPRFVRWLAQTTRMPAAAAPAAINRLVQEAKGSGDMDLARMAALLEQQANSQQDQTGQQGQSQ